MINLIEELNLEILEEILLDALSHPLILGT